MKPLYEHMLDYMDDSDTFTPRPEFEVHCRCGHSFASQGIYRFEGAITAWGEHVQEEQE